MLLYCVLPFGVCSCRAIMVICCVPGCTNVLKYLKFHTEIFVTLINFIAIRMTLTGGCQGILSVEVYHSHLERPFRKRPASLMQQNYVTECYSTLAINFLLQLRTPPHCESIGCTIAMWSCYVCVTTIYWGPISQGTYPKGLLLVTFSWTLGLLLCYLLF